MKPSQAIKDETGSVLIIALIMLVLLTLLGISATSTSNIELQIAGNERNHKRTFFAANAGIEHLKSGLNSKLVENNETNIASGSATLSWSFALAGATDTDSDSIGDYDGGVSMYTDQAFIPMEGFTYNVRIWNNDDLGGPTTDIDGKIYAQSEATGPGGQVVKIKVELQASLDGDSINSYTAQQGGESGKGYGSQDLNAISAWDVQTGDSTIKKVS